MANGDRVRIGGANLDHCREITTVSCSGKAYGRSVVCFAGACALEDSRSHECHPDTVASGVVDDLLKSLDLSPDTAVKPLD